MNLDKLPKIVDKRKKALGRGIGSGRGKTSGRGTKGQKARGKVPVANVGAGLILYKKLPYRRGWSRQGGNPARSLKPILVSFADLNGLKANSKVNMTTLIESGLVSTKQSQKRSVKILATGELKLPLIFEVPVSENAKKIIEKAGGSVNSGKQNLPSVNGEDMS
jgi:large subunit ribosomal protein L15